MVASDVLVAFFGFEKLKFGLLVPLLVILVFVSFLCGWSDNCLLKA